MINQDWLVGVCAALCLLKASASYAAEPMPPSTVCIDGAQCVNTPSSGDSTSGGIKWHPGHYMQVLRGSVERSQSYRFSLYDSIASNTAIKGVVVPFRWVDLETSKGNYSTGIATIRAELNKLKSLAVPKRLIIRFNEKPYGSAGAGADSSHFPQYLLDAGYVAATTNGSAPKLWLSAVADRQIALFKEIAANFDNDPYLEAVVLTRENTVGNNFSSYAQSTGFTLDAYTTQLRRYYAAAKSAFSKTSVIAFENYYGSQGATTSHVAWFAALGIGGGAPDLVPNNSSPSWFEKVIKKDAGVSNVEYRGIIPIMWSIEASEMGLNAVGVDGGYAPKQFFDTANNVFRITHLMWDYNNFTGTTEQRWTTGILPFINANPKLNNTACPAVYRACDSN